MSDRHVVFVVAVFVLGSFFGSVSPVCAQCFGVVSERDLPPAITGISTSDEGFRARYWAWDDFNRRRGGHANPVFVDTEDGTLVWQLDWADADTCQQPGPVLRSAVLVESLDPEGFGRWALVNIGAAGDGSRSIDEVQRLLGGVTSRAVPVPQPTIESVRVMPDVVEIRIAWSVDSAGEALSDLVDDEGWPLSSVRGYGVRIINGTQPSSRPWDWTFGHDLEEDNVNGYSTDTTALIRLGREYWSDMTITFAVGLTFDGNGDAEGELPDSRSVHGEYLGRPSGWLRLPSLATDQTVEIVDLKAWLSRPDVLHVGFSGQAEPAGASYRVSARGRRGRFSELAAFDSGDGRYKLRTQLPAWCLRLPWTLLVEMLDAEGRVIGSVITNPNSQ